MTSDPRKRFKTIMDLGTLNATNATGCPACGRKFNLGDPVVMACGSWEGGPRYIHEEEAAFDPATGNYMERGCREAGKIG